MLVNLREKIWVEKYRPQVIEDCILPEAVKKNLENFVIAGDCPNLMLTSVSGGVGKTTIAKALCNQLDLEYLFINSSEQRSIEVLRQDVTAFVSTLSLEGRSKAVIFDESDSMLHTTQSALRGFIEQYSKVKFFFSCNFIDKMLPPLLSRCSVIDFNWPKEDTKYLKTKFFGRVKQILENENISFKKEVVVELINRYFPDFRRVINELQKYSITGVIDEGLLSYSKELDLNDLFTAIQEKKFNTVREWAESNSDMNYEIFYRNFYKEMKTLVEPSCLPAIILILGQYQFRHSSVMDKNINLLCCLVEILSEVKFK
jgi:DNA polymerase III delta prime subunit